MSEIENALAEVVALMKTIETTNPPESPATP